MIGSQQDCAATRRRGSATVPGRVLGEWILESLKEFRLTVTRFTLLLAVAGATASWPMSPVAAKGILMGGLAGTIGFWITARNVGVLATPGAEKIELYAFKWTLVRLAFYALAVYKGYTLDPERYHGLIAAVIGIFLVQAVMIAYAFLRLGGNEKEEH